MTLREFLKGIADAIRDNHPSNMGEPINAKEFAGQIRQMSNEISDEQWNIGFNDGYRDGKQAEYDAFWDEFQNYGNRLTYTSAFAYEGWTDEIYNPKYPIKTTSCNQLFNAAAHITDTKVDIDLTDLRGSQKFYIFSSARKLKTVKKLIVHEGWTPTGAFDNCVALENIVIEGTLGRSINMQWSTKLTVESALSIINSLKDYTGTDKFGTYTLTFADEVWARLETVTPPNGYDSWRNYVELIGWLT